MSNHIPDHLYGYPEWLQELNFASLMSEFSKYCKTDRRPYIDAEFSRRGAGGQPPLFGEGKGADA